MKAAVSLRPYIDRAVRADNRGGNQGRSGRSGRAVVNSDYPFLGAIGSNCVKHPVVRSNEDRAIPSDCRRAGYCAALAVIFPFCQPSVGVDGIKNMVADRIYGSINRNCRLGRSTSAERKSRKRPVKPTLYAKARSAMIS